jgi:hypothetical protein
MQAAEIAGPIARTREVLPDQVWSEAYEAGLADTIEAALREASAVAPPVGRGTGRRLEQWGNG